MYQVLYRKWRPRVFEDVAGQPHVTVTLKNELKSQKINHAYLFTGSRGTGKTSCAKIMAKAVNCLNPIDGDPCGECEMCRGIDEGTVLDVSEIDAASNNGVDNIRSIIEEAAFTPSRAKYRVYIIDEVHMLSIGAFNALLKTLEEPPSHVVFILATTEVHKLPPTILSRCQRFDFHRIAGEDMAKRLEFVASEENITLEHDAALLIAAVSDGALRDALSLMDRCMSISSNITTDIVRETAGLAGNDHLFNLTDCILFGDSGQALNLVEELNKESKDPARLCEELTEHFRNLMLLKTMKKPEALIVLSKDDMDRAKEQCSSFSVEKILYVMDTLQKAFDRMSRGNNKRTELEVALVKLCSSKADDSLESVLARLATIERTIKNGSVNVTAISTPEKNNTNNKNNVTTNANFEGGNTVVTQNLAVNSAETSPIKDSESVKVKQVNNTAQTEGSYNNAGLPNISGEQSVVNTEVPSLNSMNKTLNEGEYKSITPNSETSFEQLPSTMHGGNVTQPTNSYTQAQQNTSIAEDTISEDSKEKQRQEKEQLKKKQLDFEKIVDSAVLMEDWQDVLDIIKTYSQTIAASFKDTDAYISGDYLLIDAKTDIPFKLLRQSAQRDKMRLAVKEVTGRVYKLGPYKKPEYEEAKEDMVLDLTNRLKSAGVPISETGKDNEQEE